MTIVVTIVILKRCNLGSFKKSELKAKMFEYLRQIEKTGEKLIVTDFGKPVLVILPYSAGKSVDELFADVRGKVALSDEVVLKSTTDEWGGQL